MSKAPIKVKKLANFCGELPAYQTAGSSGFDIRAQLPDSISVKLQPGERALIPTGLAFGLPEGYELQVRPRSGLAAKHGVTVLNTPGTVDADYRGEVKVILINLGSVEFVINDQDRIAQLVLAPVIQAQLVDSFDLDETDRGSGGFGSTGIKT